MIRYSVDPRTGIVTLRDFDGTDNMSIPVVCTFCGKPYDLAAVSVTQRYADCSMWKSPCCNRTADDREWKSRPDYQRIDRDRHVTCYDKYGTVYP